MIVEKAIFPSHLTSVCFLCLCIFSPKLKSHISKARSLDLIVLKPLLPCPRSAYRTPVPGLVGCLPRKPRPLRRQ